MIRFSGLLLLTFVTSLFPNANLLAQDAARQRDAKPQFTVSRKTTFVMGPLRKDGSVDFAAAINAQLSEGVNSKNNAAVQLYQAFGPTSDGLEMPRAFFKELQVEPPPAEGEYLQTLGDTIRDRGLSDQQQERLFKQQAVALSRPWSRMEFPEIANWIDQNKEPLRIVHAAVRLEKYYSPLIVDYGDAVGPEPLVACILAGTQQSRSTARLLCTRAMLHLGKGDTEAAWKDLLASHRLGRLVGMGPTVTEGVVGYAIERMSNDAELTFIRETHPTAEQAKQYREALDAMPPIARISDKVNLNERCAYLDSLLVMAWNRRDAVELLEVEDGLGAMGRIVDSLGLNSIDWDVALRRGNTWYDRMVVALELPTYSERRKTLEKLKDELKAHKSLREIKPDDKRDTNIARSIGDVVAALLLPDVAHARTAEDCARQRARNLEVSLALAAYHADHALYPENLAELKPKYLAQLPVDIFSGQAPVYRRQDAGYVLYSVGKNTRDDNGRMYGEEPAGDDLAVRTIKSQQ